VTHSELSPSKRHRWAACPGSIREEAKYPEPPDNAAAIDGTRTHAILERCIKGGCIGPYHLAGTVIEDQYGSYTVDKDRCDRVQVAIDYIRSRPGFEKALAEQRVFPDGLVGRADMHGTVDCQIPDANVYEIIDYKDGMAPVSAEGNPQLIQYALGALAGLEKHPKSFQLTIVQPKLAMRGMPVISTWNVSTKALLDAVPYIVAQAAATDDPNAPLVPGEAQCKYCRAKGACPALASKVMSEVSVMFSPVSVEVADVAQQAANKNPATMGDAELRQILEAAPLVRQLLEGVEAEVQRRLEAGQDFPGFKLVRGPGKRAWALPEDEMAKKLAGMGVPKSAMYETKIVSPAKAEKLTWEKAGAQVKLSDAQLKRMHKEYVAQQPGKPTVAPVSDSREAIVTNVAPLFNAVEVVAVVEPPPLPSFLQPEAPALPAWMM
jgi:hypothetical protein